jgi:nitrogen-specific signal transduction histidine kinase
MADPTKMNSAGLDARTLAHELNNDLGIIIAECELLERTLKNEEAGTSARVKAIRIAACRMADKISANPWPSTTPTSKPRKPSQRPS